MNLTVKLTDVHHSDLTLALSSAGIQPLAICDRCHNVEEIVVATMQILPLDKIWSLCGPCRRALPAGFNLA